MKTKYIYSLAVTVSILFLLGCNKSESTSPTVSFTHPVFFLTKTDPLEVKAYLSSPATKDLTFSLTVGGEAVRDEDYILESDKIQIAAGETEGNIRFIPKDDVVEQKQIRLDIQPAEGYQTGHYQTAFVAVESQDLLTCSFEAPAYTLSRIGTISMKLQIGTRAFSRPTKEIFVPVEIDPSSTAVLGEHYQLNAETLALKMGTGAQAATLSITPLKIEAGKDLLVIRLADSKRFLPGLYNKTTITFRNN